jgi:hypothetical protein
MRKTVKKLFLGKSSNGEQAEFNPIQKRFLKPRRFPASWKETISHEC